jgi:ferredoxin-thioredoxin reductase catalytic subunit
MSKNQHVVPHNGQWAVRGEGNQKVTSNHNTQAEAISAARGIAINQQSEVVIHRPDGRIRDKDSYGNDSCPPRDTKH